MPRPREWKGSDMRSRAEVVQWLHDHGTDVRDETGLMVGRMRTDLGKGRALSQLLLEMEQDGMIQREVRGRRTFRINLIDDWGLKGQTGAIGYRPETPAGLDGDVDLTALAEQLLAIVLKRAQATPSRGAEVEKWKERAAKAEAALREVKDELILARDSEQEQRRQADTMRKSLTELQRAMDRKPARQGTPLRERLSESERNMLDSLMKTVPARR